MKKSLIGAFCLLSSQAYAIDCYITIMKGTCWKDYDVTIEAFDATTGDSLIPKTHLDGKDPTKLNDFWVRVPFKCQAKQGIKFGASFSPAIWENNKGKIYPSADTIYLPETAKKDIFAWNIPICYPSGFSNLPIPPALSGSGCNCDDIKKVIPELKKDKK